MIVGKPYKNAYNKTYCFCNLETIKTFFEIGKEDTFIFLGEVKHKDLRVRLYKILCREKICFVGINQLKEAIEVK